MSSSKRPSKPTVKVAPNHTQSVKPRDERPSGAKSAVKAPPKPAPKPQSAKPAAPGMAQLALILFIISAVCALLLGLANLITHDRIAEAKAAKLAAAQSEVLAASEYTPVDYTGGDPLVKLVSKAGDAGYVVQVTPSGFGGAIDMMVGVNADGTVSGVSIVSMSETSGLGTNAKKDEWRGQFVGAAGSVQVSKDGGSIDAITGATITSRAVCDGVNAALSAVESVKGGN